MIECPDCAGLGESQIFVSGPGLHELRTVKCARCKGDGKITEEMARWIELGQQLRDRRMSPYRNLRDEAEALGTDPVQLSKAEAGRIDPTPFLSKERP